MKLLEDQGYRTCRSAASLGLWDVIGVGMDDVVLVQVKTNRKPPAAEMKAIQEFEVPTGVRKFVHIWKDRKREPVKIEIGAESI